MTDEQPEQEEPVSSESAAGADDPLAISGEEEEGPKNFTITLFMGDDDATVFAQIEPSEETVRVSEIWIIQQLEEAGYGEYFRMQKNIQATLKAFELGKDVQIPIAQKQDAEIELSIDEDAMVARMAVIAANGGEPVTDEMIRVQLAKAGIIFGIDDEVIQQAVAAGELESTVIAVGDEGCHGEDAKFECLVEQCYFKQPVEDDSGTVDFFDMQEFVVIETGQELMKRYPPTEGSSGSNVLGQVIPAKPGEDTPYRETPGTAISESDPSILLATMKGHPVIFEDGVDIDETLTLPKVDISTGNVTFDGSLHVNGDIGDGVVIDVTGDVMVEGVIQKAKVIAGGDILVKNGIIGGTVEKTDDISKPNDEEDPEANINRNFGANLTAVGDINARFVDNAFLQAGENIWIREYIRHSHSNAGSDIYLGKQGGKGQLIGGVSVATKLLEAKLLGTNADVHTTVEVGVPPEMRVRYDKVIQEIVRRDKQLMEQVKTFTHLKLQMTGGGAPPNEFMEKAYLESARDIKEHLLALEKLDDEKNAIESKMELAVDAKVIVNKEAYRNVVIKIKDGSFKVKEELRAGYFSLHGRKITFEH